MTYLASKSGLILFEMISEFSQCAFVEGCILFLRTEQRKLGTTTRAGHPRYDWLTASGVLRMNGNGIKQAVIIHHGHSRFCMDND